MTRLNQCLDEIDARLKFLSGTVVMESSVKCGKHDIDFLTSTKKNASHVSQSVIVGDLSHSMTREWAQGEKGLGDQVKRGGGGGRGAAEHVDLIVTGNASLLISSTLVYLWNKSTVEKNDRLSFVSSFSSPIKSMEKSLRLELLLSLHQSFNARQR